MPYESANANGLRNAAEGDRIAVYRDLRLLPMTF
jgi:hypothetical protein